MSHKKLCWSAENTVNNSELDKHHEQLCNLGNEILDAVETNQITKDELMIMLSKLADYIFYHFETEEKHLKKFDTDAVKSHLAKHEDYRKQIKDFIVETQKDKSDIAVLSKKVALFVSDWVNNHMLGGNEMANFFEKE